MYDSPETKAKIRAVLAEHMGPSNVPDDRHDLRRDAGLDIDWGTVTMALETEFDLILAEVAVMQSDTIDGIARLIDTILASKNASPH